MIRKKIVLNEVPDKKGIYFVIYKDCNQLKIDQDCFISKKAGYPTNADKTRYTKVFKAEPKKGLKQRVEQYLQIGKSGHGNHNGGKAIWQIDNTDNLLVLCYITEDDLNNTKKHICSSMIESELLKQFKRNYGTYPLANWRS